MNMQSVEIDEDLVKLAIMMYIMDLMEETGTIWDRKDYGKGLELVATVRRLEDHNPEFDSSQVQRVLDGLEEMYRK